MLELQTRFCFVPNIPISAKSQLAALLSEAGLTIDIMLLFFSKPRLGKTSEKHTWNVYEKVLKTLMTPSSRRLIIRHQIKKRQKCWCCCWDICENELISLFVSFI